MPEQMVGIDYKKFKQLEKAAYDIIPAEEKEENRIPARYARGFYKTLVAAIPISPEFINKLTEEFNNGRVSQQEFDLLKFVAEQCNGKTPEQVQYIMQQMCVMVDPYILSDNGANGAQIYSAALQRYNLLKQGKISGAEMDFKAIKDVLKGNDAAYEDLLVAHFDYIWSDKRIDIIKDFYMPQPSSDRNQVFDIQYTLKDFKLWRNPKPEIIEHVVQRVIAVVDKIIEQEIAQHSPNIDRLIHFSNLVKYDLADIMKQDPQKYNDEMIKQITTERGIPAIASKIVEKAEKQEGKEPNQEEKIVQNPNIQMFGQTEAGRK